MYGLYLKTLLLLSWQPFALSCISKQLQPNPIPSASLDPAFPISGVLNGNVAILPIPYEVARAIIPAQWPILRHQYRRWLPWLPHDQYPAMLQTELDHDVHFNGTPTGADFQRAGISFPFVDRLGDGYTAMTFNDHILISQEATAIFPGFEVFGYKVTPAMLRPDCEAYQYVEHKQYEQGRQEQRRAFNLEAFANDSLSAPGISWQMSPVHKSPYMLNFWHNVTNQPLMSYNTSSCDHFARLLNPSVSQPPYAPVAVKGSVVAEAPFFRHPRVWKNVYGIKLSDVFRESGPVPCESLKGVSVVEAPHV